MQNQKLALDGDDVCKILNIAPGPEVGRALRHLGECALENPAHNTRATLRKLLRAWHDARAR